MKEMARFKPMQRHLFLYEHAVLFCKRRDEDSPDRTPFYSFKSCLRVKSSSEQASRLLFYRLNHGCRLAVVINCVSLQLSAVGVTENVKGDVRKFEIWFSGREVVYIVQV